MQLPERPAAEVSVRDIQKNGLLTADPGVIKRAEQGIVAGRGSVLAGGADPGLQEIEELRHPFRGRRRVLGRGVIADMPGRVVLIHRADQPDPERGLDLDSLADLQETVETLEYLQVVAAGRRRPPSARQAAHYPVDIFGGNVPRGPASAVSIRSSTPVSLSIVLPANPRTVHEATNASTHPAWNTSGSARTSTGTGDL